jgi:hypothetical protein
MKVLGGTVHEAIMDIQCAPVTACWVPMVTPYIGTALTRFFFSNRRVKATAELKNNKGRSLTRKHMGVTNRQCHGSDNRNS